MTARERRQAHLWTPLGLLIIIGGFIVAAGIQGGAL